MKKASRRHSRPQVERLESLNLLSTLLVGAYHPGPLNIFTEGSTQTMQAIEGQTVTHGTVTNLTVAPSIRSTPTARIGTSNTLTVAATGRPSTILALPSTSTGTRTVQTLTVAHPQAGPIVGLNTTLRGVVPNSTRSILLNPLTIGTAAKPSVTASAQARSVSSLAVGPFSTTTGKLN